MRRRRSSQTKSKPPAHPPNGAELRRQGGRGKAKPEAKPKPKRKEPAPGWPVDPTPPHFNVRMPSVPSTLDLRTLRDYYAGGVAMGILAASTREPNIRWFRKTSFDYGQALEDEALRRRRLDARRKR